MAVFIQAIFAVGSRFIAKGQGLCWGSKGATISVLD
jgi:hypothetical protein